MRIHGLILVALTACGDNKAGELVDAGPPDSGEAPDLCSEAEPCALTPDMRSSEYISPVGDTDAFFFEASSGQILNVVVENDAEVSPVRLEVVLFGPDAMALENQRFVGNGRQRVELQRVLEATGRYLLVVRDVASDGADRRNPYYVTVGLLSESDANEPNDERAAATSIIAGQTISGSIGAQGDQDWFGLDVPAGQIIQVEMLAPGTGMVRFVWELWSPDGTTRIAQSLEPREDVPWPIENRAVGSAAGRYFIKVIDDPSNGNQADLGRVYSLTVRLVAEPDAQDRMSPNETYDLSTNFTIGDTVTGYIASTSDADWYRIGVAGASEASPRLLRVRAQTAGPSPVDLAFAIYGPDGRTLVCDARDGDLCEAFRFVEDGMTGAANLITAHVIHRPGPFFIEVRDQQDNDFDISTAYTLTIDTPTEPEAGEDYDLSGRDGARLIAAQSATTSPTVQYPWVEGYISHANDQDWYRFDIPGPGAQNGDWRVQLELQIPGPTPVELQAFFYGPEGSQRESYRGYGKECREPNPNDRNPCQFPDAENGINATLGEASGDCFVVFREITGQGPHYFRLTDLDRDDFDISANGRYRLRINLTAGCPVPGLCAGIFTQNGMDLCGRP